MIAKLLLLGFWIYGGTDANLYDKAKKENKIGELPANHSSKFAPVIMPTLQNGLDAYVLAALTWLVKLQN